MSGDERGGETFLAKVDKGNRVTIHALVRESLGLEVGDLVRINLDIVARGRAQKEETKG